MRKFLLLVSLLTLAVLPMLAADVDLSMAQASAQRFLLNQAVTQRFTGVPGSNLRLLHAEANSSRVSQAVYYIFNSDQGFVIIAGDDRAQEVLAYGDRQLDMKRLPENMKFWLGTYKKQIEYLQSHPGLVVDKPKMSQNLQTPTIAPMLTAEWDQDAPYYNHCPVYDGMLCLTGCPATSLSMVFYHWKYPTDPTPEVDSYLCTSLGTYIEALPSITFDWDNMLDKYTGSYTTAQADAVAWLMRYVGQAEHMSYAPDGSGALGDDILRAVKFFGYDETAELVTKSVADYYGTETELVSDEDWAAMLQTELAEGRPVVYCAFDYSTQHGWSGHAFNVDGYTAGTGTYHVNWGWSGEGNGDFALNAFNYGNYSFNIEQQMIIGIQPPITTPTIRVSSTHLEMDAYVEKSSTASFMVTGKQLIDGITLSLDDESGAFSLDAGSVDFSDAEQGKVITVTYSPQEVGYHTATVTLSSPEADDVTVTINGEASLETYVPVMLPADSAYIGLTSFRADWTDLTEAKNVSTYALEVNTKPGPVLIGEADWSDIHENSTNYADNPAVLLPQGWTFNGTGLWREESGISINNKSSIITPAYDLVGYDKVTVLVVAKSSMSQSSSKFIVSTGADEETFTTAAGSPFAQYVAVLDCNELDQVTIAGKSGFPVFQSIEVYAGEVDAATLRAVAEQGDTDYRIITGIENRYYTVTGLTPAGNFYYRVKAFYVDGTESEWSRSQNVTLFGSNHGYRHGDVNHDGHLAIDDVTLLIDFLLNPANDICPICADVDADNAVSIADVTALIDLLLAGE